MTEKRAYVASHFALDIDGKMLGFCRSVDGGGIKAEALTHQTGPNQDLWRYIGRPKYDDISIQVGIEMSKAFYEWIADFFSRKGTRKNGALIAADFNYKEKARRTFTEALISEIQMPGVDGSDKNPIYMTVKLAPEQLQYGNGTNNKIQPGDLGTDAKKQKRWLAANFRLELQGLEQALWRVQKVDGFTIKQQILEYPAGPKRFPTKVAGRLEYPNMTFYMPLVDAAPVIEMLKDRVERNKPKVGKGITGALVYETSDGKDLCTVGLEGVDIISVEPEKFESTAENISRVKVQIHVEKMTFKYA